MRSDQFDEKILEREKQSKSTQHIALIQQKPRNEQNQENYCKL